MTHDEIEALFVKATASIYRKNFKLAFECFDRLVQHGDELDAVDLKHAQIGLNMFDPNGDKDEAARGLMEIFSPTLIRFVLE